MPKIGKGILVSEKEHDNILQHLRERLWFGNQIRGPLVDRFEIIDREIHGHLILSDDDKKRDADNKKGYGVKPIDQKLPLTLTQIDEAVTIAANMLAPDEGMYQAIAPKDEQSIAKGFTALMNRHAAFFNHYGNLTKGLANIFKYNLGGWDVEWDEFETPVVKNKGSSRMQFEVVTSHANAGNRQTALPMYNTIWDPSVDVTELSSAGEFYAKVSRITDFAFNRMIYREEVYNVESVNDVVASSPVTSGTSAEVNSFFRKPPTIVNTTSQSVPNWVEIFGGSDFAVNVKQVELVNITCWIEEKASAFRLGKTPGYSLWRFTIANMRKIVNAVRLTNSHGMLPIGMAKIIDDEIGNNVKSYGELLIPFNQFSSFQLNAYQSGVRRALYGLTFYLKHAIPDLADSTTDMLAGNIPVDDAKVDDIRKAVMQINDAPDMKDVLSDIGKMSELMQKVLPTDVLKQVTDLERATRYQAAATVQGTNRRSLKIARMIDAQALTRTRFMQMYNIFTFQKEMKILQEDGNLINIDPSELRSTQIEFAVSEGLKALDRLSAIENIKEILTMVIQNRQSLQEIDVVSLLNYLTSLMGDKTDLSQFKFKNPFDALDPQMKKLAFQLLKNYMQQLQQQKQEGSSQTPPGVNVNETLSGLEQLMQGVTQQTDAGVSG